MHFIYRYIDRQLEASFSEKDFLAFSEMKNIFHNMTKTIYQTDYDCELDRISFIIRSDTEFTAYLHCKSGLRAKDIDNRDLKLAQMLSNYKILWITLSKNSLNKLENIFFSKKINVIYTSNIYNENECDVKVIEDLASIPDEKIEVCKMYCQKLKYKKWYLCKIIEESKALF